MLPGSSLRDNSHCFARSCRLVLTMTDVPSLAPGAKNHHPCANLVYGCWLSLARVFFVVRSRFEFDRSRGLG